MIQKLKKEEAKKKKLREEALNNQRVIRIKKEVALMATSFCVLFLIDYPLKSFIN